MQQPQPQPQRTLTVEQYYLLYFYRPTPSLAQRNHTAIFFGFVVCHIEPDPFIKELYRVFIHPAVFIRALGDERISIR